MGEVVASAATGALGAVVGKLATLASDEYKRLRGVPREIESLSRELDAMKAFLEKMSEAEEEADPRDKVWMNQVRELSYDAEDSIDDFVACVAARPDGFMGKIKNLVSRTIEDLKRQIDEVSQRNARYRPGESAASVSKKTKIDRRALVIFEDASKLVGVDGPKEEVIQLLADDGESTDSTQQQQQQPTKVVAIVGPGGLGKTTLANRVYEEIKEDFDCRAFLSVSQNPDIVRVMSKIFSQLTGYSADANEDLPQLITKIRDFLTDGNKSLLSVQVPVYPGSQGSIHCGADGRLLP
ncbi:putative disease resistance protein At1g59780 isoform X2 [Brachypodium distachyon]|uniref:putative disease resistance protein At1g59780 isoform X2 n=1 Tax=Brachypodium distachyon TaxID=15368 RepID=UPI0006E47259|nr:putative disease resistance protein At1g59780 isoform X2 [Brachypodium distachyon]|eukprot:XP_024311095.1 putative disease resistance protein At1g59780 isoform X2 [Brachypodium distachyon]